MLDAHVLLQRLDEGSQALRVENILPQVEIVHRHAISQAMAELKHAVAVDSGIDQLESLEANIFSKHVSDRHRAFLVDTQLAEAQFSYTLGRLLTDSVADLHELLGAESALHDPDRLERLVASDSLAKQGRLLLVHLILFEH